MSIQQLFFSISNRIDDYFKYVTMLLSGEGTNAAQNNTFLDSSSNALALTRNGNTNQGTFTPYVSNWSNYFTSSSGYIRSAASANLAADTGSFTIEFWYLSTINANGRPAGNGNNDVWGANKWVFANQATGKLEFFVYNYSSGTAMFSSTSSTVAYDGQWHHIAIVRSSNTWAMFIDGTRQGTTVTSSVSLNSTSSTINVGWSYLTGDSAAAFSGYISNFRFVKGTAVYDPTQSTITVPTEPLTAIANTAYLTCQSNRYIDNSTNAFAITAVGTPSVQHFSPFSSSSSYSSSTVGGSGYFDGSGDNLQVTTATAAVVVTDGAFTLEAWAYNMNNAGSYYMMISEDDGSSTAQCFQFRVNASKLELVYFTTSARASAVTVTSTASIPINAWNHLAVSWGGANTPIKLFINGVLDTTTSNVAAIYAPATIKAAVGSQILSSPAAGYWTGYICDARILKGTQLYTATFTPPTAPLTAIANTALLCSFTNAAVIDSAMMNNLETLGDAQISTTQSKFGGSSIKFDGTGDWLTAPATIDQQFGAKDFTIEGWFYLGATGIAQGIVSKGTSTTGWSVNVTSGNKLQFSYTATSLAGSTTLTSGTWYHFAVVRSGSSTGNLKIYLNGTADATSAGAVTDNFNQTSIMYVGADRVGTSPMNGYVDDLRITRGYARYTGNFTVPDSAFPNR